MARYSQFHWDDGSHYDEPETTTTTIKPTHMIDLHRFLTNPFDDPGISIDELLAFTTDHQQRMTANNTGGFLTARITATNTALGVLGTTVTDDQTKLAIRKARKQAKDDFRKSLPDGVGKIYGAVIAKYGPNGVETTECFPEGRGVFAKSTDDRLANQLQTLINGVTAHQADLGAPLVADATALLTGWNAVYSTSESSAGAKTTTQAAKNAARASLQLELFKNLLTIALQFPRQPEQVDVYMQQSLLEDHPVTPDAPTPPPPTPPGP